MNIRKGKPEDMHAVLGLIQELAVFEKEPDAVLVTVDDLIRDGLALFLYFMFCCRKRNDSTDGTRNANCRYRFTIIAFRLGKEKQFI
jgi:hypothetical protein